MKRNLDTKQKDKNICSKLASLCWHQPCFPPLQQLHLNFVKFFVSGKEITTTGIFNAIAQRKKLL